jgi:hypothetical protein
MRGLGRYLTVLKVEPELVVENLGYERTDEKLTGRILYYLCISKKSFRRASLMYISPEKSPPPG